MVSNCTPNLLLPPSIDRSYIISPRLLCSARTEGGSGLAGLAIELRARDVRRAAFEVAWLRSAALWRTTERACGRHLVDVTLPKLFLNSNFRPKETSLLLCQSGEDLSSSQLFGGREVNTGNIRVGASSDTAERSRCADMESWRTPSNSKRLQVTDRLPPPRTDISASATDLLIPQPQLCENGQEASVQVRELPNPYTHLQTSKTYVPPKEDTY